MAADSPEKLHLKSPLDDSAVNNLSFSMDSLQLGDSTRSLLSPLYERGVEKSFHFANQNENGESYLSEGELVDNVKPSRSNSSSENDHSRTGTVKKGKMRDSRSNSGSSCDFSSSSLSSTPKSQEVQNDIESELSPWEKWLLNKVINDHERTKNRIKKKRFEKELSKKEMAEKVEQERKAMLNRQEWLELKSKEERKRTNLRRRKERMEAETKQEEERRLQEKAEESYRKWNESKENERKEIIKSKQKERLSRKQEEYNRKQKNDEAYEKWLEKAKDHPKLTKTRYGYLSGKVTGYYDWTCYPMPSYNNPNPWVGPKVKRKHLPIGKIQLQNPSPPLLFKELEQREQNNKSKLKTRKDAELDKKCDYMYIK